MQRVLAITAADSNYFRLVQGTIQSLRDKAQDRPIDIGFFDLGCTDEQKAWLKSRVDCLREPQWHFAFPSRAESPDYLRGLLVRPFLREYFPGYEVYLWLDADAWVQDGRAIDLLVEGARRRCGLAIVPEVDRGSLLQYGGLPSHWSKMRGWYSAAFGAEIGTQLCSYPTLNAGVMALHRDALHWKAWEDALRAALQRTCTRMTDQTALNFAVYRGGLFQHSELLPAWCNWTCHYGLPSWDEATGCLVEPYLPHTPIGVLHLTVQKLEQGRVMTTQGKLIDVSLRYPAQPVQAESTAGAGILDLRGNGK